MKIRDGVLYATNQDIEHLRSEGLILSDGNKEFFQYRGYCHTIQIIEEKQA